MQPSNKFILILAILSSTACAQDENWLLGRWAWRNDCTRPDFIFEPSRATINGDADGASSQWKFNEIKYSITPSDQIRINLGKNHGFIGTTSPTEMDFTKIDALHAQLKRERKGKDISQTITRCQ
jgi:hypothetical protein